MKLIIFWYICVMVLLALYCPVEAKKKTDNCLPKNTPSKTDDRKMIPTIMPRNGARAAQRPLESSLAEDYDDDDDVSMDENSMDGDIL